jgi:hypothetical protein
MVKKSCVLFFILISLSFIISSLVDKETSWHDSDNIFIQVDGYSMTLQEAIDNNVFKNGADESYTEDFVNPGHRGSSVWISVNLEEMTLQRAILEGKLCGGEEILESYSNVLEYCQFGDEIELDSGKSLQEAIDNGDFCYEEILYSYLWYTGPWGPCIDNPYDYNLDCVQTRVVYCKRDDGQQVPDGYCDLPKPDYEQNCDCPVW